MKADKERPDMVNLSGLKERGWTPALIERFLGEPDKLVPNPHYRSGPSMRLYFLKRVKASESGKRFQKAFASKATMRQASKTRGIAVSRQKRDELFEWVDTLTISLPTYSEDALFQNAVRHYKQLWDDREQFDKTASVDSDRNFLLRISVNYLRHECTSYENLLEKVHGKVGVNEARLDIKIRVLTAIAEAFPILANECSRQSANVRG